MIETVVIRAPSRASDLIFGRPLLERLILICERAGVKRFFIEGAGGRAMDEALGDFRGDPKVGLVDSLEELFAAPFGIERDRPCLAMAGNLVFARSQLDRMIATHAAAPDRVIKLASGGDGNGLLATGPIGEVLAELGKQTPAAASGAIHPYMPYALLPYALDGRPENGREAEFRLARSVRLETVAKDGILARLLDRRVSWRISYRLGRTAITPNQVTLFNTALGFVSAAMFSLPSYWWRLLGSILFLAGITIDGVDGELARLKMCETDWGGKLDMITDNIVHVALFVGLMAGCYRASGNPAYFYLLPILLVGFALCAAGVAFAVKDKEASAAFLGRLERLSSRDFAYLLVDPCARQSSGIFRLGKCFWNVRVRAGHLVVRSPRAGLPTRSRPQLVQLEGSGEYHEETTLTAGPTHNGPPRRHTA